MFGFIKNLAKRSDNNFFLELKEEVEEKIADVKEEVGNKISDVKENIEDKKGKVAAKVKEVEQETKQEAKQAATKQEPKPAPAQAPAAASSNGKMSRKETTAAAEARPKDPSELAAAAVKKAEVQLTKETNFATKYLMTPSSNGRRRPGPNMNSFLEMASKVKTPTEKK